MSSCNVLVYTKVKQAPGTVRRHYLKWRKEQTPPLPVRCDNPECAFFTAPLIWNGKQLKPILDHKDGVNSNNVPDNLRLLCPNCDSQLPTRAGKNRGRIRKSSGGFGIKRSKNGPWDNTLHAGPGLYSVGGASPTLSPSTPPSSSRKRRT